MTTDTGQVARGSGGASPREDLRSEARALGLTDSEYDLIREKLARAPNGLEPVSYTHLTLPTTPYV